ncbi:DUF429 domain-containing protein, partial [Pseudonocardia nantongensis]|uniref:DUF429 domain-containing protein n=1 Tax=Pseudonocardia nantongensis TaxID=1181885 RepID=UPI00397E2FD7
GHRVVVLLEFCERCSRRSRGGRPTRGSARHRAGHTPLWWTPLTGVVEAHPELSFRTLAPDVGFANKKTARGAGQRIAALTRWVDPATALGDLPAGTRLDDVLDALVTAWTAARVARGEAEFLGPGRDARGRSTAIAV